jgi:hypothetical protein
LTGEDARASVEDAAPIREWRESGFGVDMKISGDGRDAFPKPLLEGSDRLTFPGAGSVQDQLTKAARFGVVHELQVASEGFGAPVRIFQFKIGVPALCHADWLFPLRPCLHGKL